MERLAKEVFGGGNGPLNSKILAMSQDPALHYTSWASIGVIFSFIVLMVDKPNWLGSILWVLAGILAGATICWLAAKALAKPRPRPTRRIAKSAH
jgi:hypothetical protein